MTERWVRPDGTEIEVDPRTAEFDYVCLICGETWTGGHTAGHECPECDSDAVRVADARDTHEKPSFHDEPGVTHGDG